VAQNIFYILQPQKSMIASFNVCCYQGGSLKKDTAIKGNADLDLVVFLNEIKDMSDYQRKLPEILKELTKNVIDSGIATFEYRAKHGLKISLGTKVVGDYFGVDILPVPTFNNIKHPGTFY